MKRKRNTKYIGNPYINEERKNWSVTELVSLTRSVSPPVASRRKSIQPVTTAEAEAGEQHVEDHLSFFSSQLLSATRTVEKSCPRLDHQAWIDFYSENADNPRGRHFVIHQHDHPVAGTHYDLRLQCNETSSVSWAIMYGLPGDPNSRRLNRNATETRIHCLWNHLIETASHQTGSLLIWDTGVYEVLPYHVTNVNASGETTDEDESGKENHIDLTWTSLSEPGKLHASFQNRKIRLRLHGTRLPENYTISLRLSRDNDRSEQPATPKTKRKRRPPSYAQSSTSKPSKHQHQHQNAVESDTDTGSRSGSNTDTGLLTIGTSNQHSVFSLHRRESPPTKFPSASNKQDTSTVSTPPNMTQPVDEETHTRPTNAYPGAHNSIGSIHQRRWYLSLDPASSGFVRHGQRRPTWDATSGFPPFRVLGPAHERSVVTGRVAAEILSDEGVAGYVARGGWRPVLE